MKHLILAGVLAFCGPALAAPADKPEVKTDTTPQPTTANDMAVATGANVQTARTAEDAPAAGPEKPAGAPDAPKKPAVPPR
jgi:hypothetical protein